MTILQNVFTGSAIDASLKLLAERRTDIFGVGDEETAIGKKIGEEDVRKDEKVTWDGHTSSVEAATRAARANITLEEQIHQIHKVGFCILTGCKCLNGIVTGEGVVA
jgi:splicing factor 3A subunit 1